MAIFKCKICGGTLEIDIAQSVATCEYCSTKQTIPRLDDDRRANLYDRANHFRRNNDFDKAMGIYEAILNEDSTDAEAYWSIVLCRYGIEYVEDPMTHKRVPTVNRAQFTSIFDDEDYKSALSNADGYQREIYESEAKVINEIQKGFLDISQKEEPFDVFICYKETDTSGRRTQDSVPATELYHELTREGIKVFFSRITLEDKLGIAYEPYIFAALNSAKVMVVLGTRPEHFDAVWVKNEWSRYLALIKNGAKKTLIPAYRNMDPYDLPEEFSHLQAQDMSRLGFMQDLIRGIKKVSDEPGTSTVINAPSVANSQTQSVYIETLLSRGFLALEAKEWKKADSFFEQALNIDSQNANAYLGKLLSKLKLKSKDSLKNISKSLNKDHNYILSLRFADADLKNFLLECEATVKDRRIQAKAKVKSWVKLIPVNILAYFLTGVFAFYMLGSLADDEVNNVVCIAISLLLEAGLVIFYLTHFCRLKKMGKSIHKSLCVAEIISISLVFVSSLLTLIHHIYVGFSDYNMVSFFIITISYMIIFCLLFALVIISYGKRKLCHLVRIGAVFGWILLTSTIVFLFYISPLQFEKLENNSYSFAGSRAPIEGVFIVPETYNNKPVTQISSHAFAHCSSLNSVTIPDGVRSIGWYAFEDCSSLTNITIPGSVTSIGAYAFYNCGSLTSVTIPDGVTSICAYAFSNCDSLTSVTIPDGVTSIGEGAFAYCSGLTNITIPKSVTSIDRYAFSDCSGLTSIMIPYRVTYIGFWAFRSCESLTIYCEATFLPKGWHNGWNYCGYSSDTRLPVVWSYKKTY